MISLGAKPQGSGCCAWTGFLTGQMASMPLHMLHRSPACISSLHQQNGGVAVWECVQHSRMCIANDERSIEARDSLQDTDASPSGEILEVAGQPPVADSTAGSVIRLPMRRCALQTVLPPGRSRPITNSDASDLGRPPGLIMRQVTRRGQLQRVLTLE
jgi:hypothetical protein